jgi:hypothetical protein
VADLFLPLLILLSSIYLISYIGILNDGSFIAQIFSLNMYLACFFMLASKKNILKVFRLFFN